MTIEDARGDRWTVLGGWLRGIRSGTGGRLIAVVPLDGEPTDDAELVRAVEPIAHVVVLWGPNSDRLDAARARFARPGRVRVEPDEKAALAAAREATGPEDRIAAVSGNAGVVWDGLLGRIGTVRRSA